MSDEGSVTESEQSRSIELFAKDLKNHLLAWKLKTRADRSYPCLSHDCLQNFAQF